MNVFLFFGEKAGSFPAITAVRYFSEPPHPHPPLEILDL